MRIIVLGAGRVGRIIAQDLAGQPDFEVTVADVSREALAAVEQSGIAATVSADLGRPDEVARVVAGHDLVVGAVPGPIGFATLRAVIEAGVDVVDISFFEEDPFPLDELARERDVIAVMDCGIAPGASNMILGYQETQLEKVERFSCMVGGLPTVRHWPFEYRAVFSPIDVIAEYTRPARIVVGGEVVVRPALSDVEYVDVPGVGTLEAFVSDGLRTLLGTSSVANMVEKTLRYPGHAERMRMLREVGFFAEEPVDVAGVAVRPIDLTSRLMFQAWQMRDDDEDLTVMRVEVEGRREEGARVLVRYELLDRLDRATGATSMARTTGYSCTAAVRAIASKLYTERGLSPPEYLGRAPGVFDLVMNHLAERGVCFRSEETVLD